MSLQSPAPSKADENGNGSLARRKVFRNETGSSSRRSVRVTQCRIILFAIVFLNFILLILIHSKYTPTQKVYDASSFPLDDSFGLPSNASGTGLFKTTISKIDGVFTLVGKGPFVQYSKPNLWDASVTLPDWMKQYMKWHQEQMKTLTPETFKSKKFLVMSCSSSDKSCGGAADRLRSVPVMILIASLTERILMIRWQRPCRLQEFLLPPKGGLDWRVPSWMESHVPQKPSLKSIYRIEKFCNKSEIHIVLTRYQSHHYGEEFFLERLNNTLSYGDIFHDLWRVMFTPVPAVAQMIQQSMDDMNIEAGKYIAAHVRGLYIHNDRSDKKIEALTRNALDCASKLSGTHSNMTIYFASDTKHASIYARDWEQKVATDNHHVVTIAHEDHPLHLDKATDWQKRLPSEYYAAFRDIYILGQSQCVSFGHGGYGAWGSILGYNWKCKHQYVNPKYNLADIFEPCKDIQGEKYIDDDRTMKHLLPTLVLPINYTSTEANNHTSVDPLTRRGITTKITEDWNVTKIATTLPRWMIEYFQWHRDQRRLLTEENWRNHTYLVMFCGGFRCGGTADRLAHVPITLLIAAMTKRILFIHWTSPCSLEEFLVPPVVDIDSKAKHDKIVGIDWRLPPFMSSMLNTIISQKSAQFIYSNSKNREDIIVVSTAQPIDHGRSFFNNTLLEDSFSSFGYVENVTEYESFYSEMFHALFTPSSPVAKAIANKSAELGLVAGNYTAAHLRALFARKDRPFRQTEKLTTNALNCASNLQPGVPIYFASDTKVALDVAQEYARNYSRPIVVWARDAEPLHLGFASSRNPSDYYETFMDLYLLAQGNCIAYSNGGFAWWASLIRQNNNNSQSSSPSCTVQHFRQRQIQECIWTDNNGPPPKLGRWYRLSNAIPG